VPRTYDYVGSAEIAAQARAPIERLQPRSPDEIRSWRLARGKDTLELTYIVDATGALWLSDRRTEHVACARGGPVLGAGELVLRLGKHEVTILEVTNQSTGFCPEPSCWPAVRAALQQAGLRPPAELTHAFDFRRCERCGTINLLKDDGLECADCSAELPSAWNLDRLAG
jgi:hypothetical protein